MALEPAGVSLEAEGFAAYLKKLDKVDKEQQEVFDTEFKGTKKSFVQVTKAAKVYEKELNDLAKTERRATDEAKKLVVQQKQIAKTQKLISAGIVAAGVTAGARAVFNFSKESLELARIQAKAEAQLATAIKSTGAAANLSSRELKNLASELQGLTNFGDEATIQAEALLLTFTSIGRDTFPRALKSILNVSAALGQDLNSSVLQVGKALNNPIEGVSALTRSGIQFTAQQKEQIKTLQESGRLFEAQGVILGELEKQFGGSARAAREADGGIIALSNSFGDLQEQLGLLIQDLNKASGATAKLGGFFDTLSAQFRGARAQLGFGDVSDEIAGLEQEINSFEKVRATLAERLEAQGGESRPFILQFLLKGTSPEEIEKLDEKIAELKSELGGLNLQATTESEKELASATRDATQATQGQEQAIKDNASAINALNQAVKQAEQLQLSFARVAQDAALKLSRQQEDVARKIAQQIAKLDESQAKARASLLDSQVQELARLREDAGRERLRAQERLQRELQRSQERFNLSQLQSERRFALSEKRLIAEGDILGLQQLREDAELQRQEEKENFDAQKKDTQDNARDQEGDERENFERQQAQLLANFDRQLADQQQAQAEAQASLQLSFTEQAEDRAIALQREQEDRRINQQRQLEDLGRSLVNQKDITKEGAIAIAGELENVFGAQGVADLIIGGFTARTESEFAELFGNLAQIISGGGISSSSLASGGIPRGGGIGQSFDDGGVVQGPVGSPQIVQAHAGETILPTHKQSFNMPAPVMPSQVLSVEMSGGFNISGAEGAPEGVIEAAVEDMAATMEITMKRLARRSNI